MVSEFFTDDLNPFKLVEAGDLASELQLAFRRRGAIAIEPLEWLQVGRAGALEPPRLRGVFEIVVSAHRPRVRCGLVGHAAKLPFWLRR
jgi:hypothetical protein